jgi:hypothetical protein
MWGWQDGMNARDAAQGAGEPRPPQKLTDLAAAYALGAADAEEAGAFLRLVAARGSAEAAEAQAAAQAAAELQAYQELAELLLFAPPPAAAPPGLAARLRAALDAPVKGGIQEAAAGGTAGGALGGAPVSAPGGTAEAAVGTLSAHAAAGVGATVAAAGAQIEEAGALPPGRKPAPGGRAWSWPLAVALAAAAIAAALLLFSLLAMRDLDALRLSQASLQQQVALQAAQATQGAGEMATRTAVQEAALAATLAVQGGQIATQDALLTQLVVGESERYTMTAVQPDSSAVANVAWLDEENVAILRAEGFPPLGEGKAYQLWLIRGETRTSGGLFTVDEYGCGTYVFHPTESLEAFDGMGITPEPAAGSPGPTSPPVVRAQL